jgi:hypothetical protein
MGADSRDHMCDDRAEVDCMAHVTVEHRTVSENARVVRTITACFDDGRRVIARYRIRLPAKTEAAARSLGMDLVDHAEAFLEAEANAPWMK